MINTSNLLEFKTHLENLKNAKENAVIILEKKAAERIVQSKNKEYLALEKEVDAQENFNYHIDESCKYATALQINTDIQGQLADKKIELEIVNAEKLINNLSVEELDLFPEYDLEKEKIEKKEKQIQILQDLDAQKSLKELGAIREKQEENVTECIAEEQSLLKAIRQELMEQKRKQATLLRKHIQIGLLHSLENQIEAKQEIQDLRIEEECWSKLEELKREEERKNVQSLAIENKLQEEREIQIRVKQNMEMSQKRQDEEYLRLLMALQAEEERLEELRVQIRRRKESQHRVVAQQILEERRKRRRHVMAKLKDDELIEKEFMEIREKLFEEEEKRLLLTYLPHLGPYLTPTVLSKLSAL